MENGDIGLLRYCFSAAGQKNQKETADWLQKVSDCLQNAGAGKVFMDEKKDEILFRVNHRKASEKKRHYRIQSKNNTGQQPAYTCADKSMGERSTGQKTDVLVCGKT